MRPVILYRPADMDDGELPAAQEHFTCFQERTAMQRHDLVIGRYSVLPYFEGIQADADYVGATLLNNLKQHRYIADLRNWVEDVRELTPKTWYRIEDIDEEGPYVLKGKTNSRKFDWRTHMFAADKKAAGEVYWRLSTDGLIGGGNQDIYIRKFVPLKTYFKGLNDLPVTKEFRFFTAYGEVICGAFYWANYADDMDEIPQPEPKHIEFVKKVLQRVNAYANAFVVDVAEKEDGELVLVELNDFQMSGLSLNDPKILYAGLRDIVRRKFNV